MDPFTVHIFGDLWIDQCVDVMSSSGNYRAVIEYLHLDPQDLLVCDLDQTRVFRPNFFVAIDRRLSAVIISIRGTMSLKDTLTDLSFEYVSWNGGIAHSGMLMAARWFFENVGKQLVMFCEEYNLQQILLTGYSLGGSTAALLTIMLTEDLRNTNTWPRTDGKLINIHCYSFATPAALSAGLAEKYLDLIDSFIFGDDIVPRLSYGTVADLQTLMVYAAEIGRAADLLGTFEGTELEQKLEACRKVIQEGKKVVNPKLRIPGRVYHLQSINAPGNRTYTVVDTCGPDRFLEVILKKNMLYDHLPNRYEQAFEDAYVTHLLHGLEDSREVATGTPVSLQDRMQSVIDLINDAKSSDGLSSTSAATKSP